MPKQPTVDFLLNRFREEIHSALYPFLILSVIEQHGSASRDEIKDEIFQLTGGTIDYDVANHKRLMGRMEKTFRLIEPVGEAQGTDLMHYGLTKKGQSLFAQASQRVISPLSELLSS